MTPLVLLLLAGCGPNVEGYWKGSCGGVSPDGVFSLPFQVYVKNDDGDEISGKGRFWWNGYEFEGRAYGHREGDEVKLDLPAVAGGYVLTLSVDGKVDEDEIEGECAFDDPGGELAGDAILER